LLAFVAGKFDMTFPYFTRMPQLKDIRSQVPQAICEVTPAGGVNGNLLVNRDKPPFNDRELRRAMALSLDRKAFIDILDEGQGDIGGVLQPPPGGQWGMPPEMLKTLPGYGPDIEKNRAEARQIMQKLGYGPNNPLQIKMSTRDLPIYRDPAVILNDQLKQVYIDGELDLIDTSRYFPKIMRKEFTVSFNLQTSDPNALDLFYGCGSSLNWDGYRNPEVDKLIEQQSREADQERRRQILWTIERKLAEDFARPIIAYGRVATCWQPYVKNITLMVNSVFSANRREDTWLDK
jgi:peptide/nickel transport system substrate-binding protein